MAETEKPPSNRWWEYYYIRYFVGTVVGGLVIFSLSNIGSKIPLLNNVNLNNTAEATEALAKNFTVIAALSFAYCYIASAPLLTLHTTRAHLLSWMGLITTAPTRKSKYSGWFFLVVCIAISALFAYLATRHRDNQFCEWLKIFGYSLVVTIQGALIFAAFRGKGDETLKFYLTMSRTRARKTSHVEGYTESYRHLREHGNAYGIIVLEFILAPAIAWACPPWQLAMVLLLWLLPPALCWLIATMLESKLMSAPEEFPADIQSKV